MSEHKRIWLEPEPGSDPDGGRMWAENDVWGDGTEYVLASEIAAALAAAEERGRIEERERCANIAQAIASGRRSQQVDAIIRGNKREAKDFESMKFCAIEIFEAITKEPTP